MSRPLRIEFSGALYHITSRGNERKWIYRTDTDRCLFLEVLDEVCERYCGHCHAYCLMSNYYHLLIEIVDANLGQGMRHLNGVYTQWYNRSHQRVGHVFQGCYKAILVEKNSYLLELSRYIVLKPVRAGMVRSARDWRWSSYRATAGFQEKPAYLVTDTLLGYFGRQRKAAQLAYRRFVAEGKHQASPWAELKNQIYLGSERFVEDIQANLKLDQSLDEIPKPQRLRAVKSLSYCYTNKDEAMAAAYRSSHYTLKVIGEYFGVSNATVSRVVQAFKGCDY